jgi:short-subunit dehydrogenase
MNILITGASRGIGAATKAALQARGARVIGHASQDGSDQIGEDLSDPAAPARVWARALEALNGQIDVLINNAGVFEAAPIQSEDEVWAASWARTLQINLQASADLCRLAIRHFEDRGQPGRIINIASRAAYRGDSPAHWHYAASKGGMVAMTKSIARGFAGQGILAFAICPGFVMTGDEDTYLASRGGERLLADIPLGRVADPSEVASVATFLALDAPASMTGAVLDVNGASFVR